MFSAAPSYARKIDSAVFPGMQGGPLDHVIAAKAVALREALAPSSAPTRPRWCATPRRWPRDWGNGGCAWCRAAPTNIVLVDLTALDVTGKEAAVRCEAAGIVTNMNLIPFDSRKPTQTSGLRLGTPALTTRGFGEAEMDQVADLLVSAITKPEEANLARCRAAVRALCERFPAPVEGLASAVPGEQRRRFPCRRPRSPPASRRGLLRCWRRSGHCRRRADRRRSW